MATDLLWLASLNAACTVRRAHASDVPYVHAYMYRIKERVDSLIGYTNIMLTCMSDIIANMAK